MPTAVRYWLFQLPGVVVVGVLLAWASDADWISPAVAVALMTAWIVKDAAFYPLTREAYRSGGNRPGPAPGDLVTVRKPLSPLGTVVVNGTLWNARVEGAAVVERGATVRIVESRGLLLVVTPGPPGRQ